MNTHIITIRVFNSFTKAEIVTFVFPWDPIKSMFGWYSDFYRSLREDIANSKGMDKHFIRAKIWREPKKTDRMIVSFPSGTKLDSPFHLTKKDIKILGLHLEAARIAYT